MFGCSPDVASIHTLQIPAFELSFIFSFFHGLPASLIVGVCFCGTQNCKERGLLVSSQIIHVVAKLNSLTARKKKTKKIECPQRNSTLE